MASFNKVILLWKSHSRSRSAIYAKGSAVCDLGIAVNRVYTTDSGEKREEVTYVDVVLWARLAEIAGEYLKKGRPVSSKAVCRWTPGRQTDWAEAYEAARSGRSMQLLGGRPGGAGGGAETTGDNRQTSAPPKPSAPAEAGEDEIPF